MTHRGNLDALRRVSHARYLQTQLAFQTLVAEENRLRSELARLDAQLRGSRTEDATEMRAIGADVIWQAWVGRAKTELNLSLARVLAQKEHHLRQVRRAYGKTLVTEGLVAEEKALRSRKMARTNLERAIETAVINQRQ
ncbi:hypothetical protein [Sulfitobacter sabulilitoris]|uniref:Flagellar FliJ protein n=1 Tax=Sulfitobacter sabulilitoris TaxID=2562655 RepID=A0A5S3Q6N6_9RHOB|nr:hypothetical protein [Sulfitobacter sabulilitoris]TMM52503.1 hypothetical protein FDT80_09490 [Sulfitobacter sabulilitoris]